MIKERLNEIHTKDGGQLKNGIGIHFGSVVAGTIGALDRFEYTIIGDTVNTASRLEALLKTLGHQIVISEETYSCLSK